MKIFYLPDLGEGLAEAEIREWYVKTGETVTVDQPVASMETAKAVVDVPSPYAGKIVELHGKANEMIQTGAPLITFDVEESASDKSKGSVVGVLEESETKWNEGDTVIIGAAKTKTAAVKAMPAARLLAKEMNVDLSQVSATGPQGLITPDDVKKHMQQHASLSSFSSSPSTSSSEITKVQALHGVRRMMANAMTQSHREIVPVTVIEDADITDCGKNVDMTVCLLQAIVAAVKAEPALNAWFDSKTLEIKLFDHVNIGLAVDTPEGLFVPVIKHAEQQSADELRRVIDTYKKTVRDRTVAPADMQGATITLSNFGMISGRYATPIIMPPAVAILGCGRSRDAVLARQGQAVVGRIVPLSLTFDHRAVTGGEATRFLSVIIQHLQKKE